MFGMLVVLTAGNIRNLAMEKVAGSVLFPCRYVSNGCNATMPHTDKSSHEDGCEFRYRFGCWCIGGPSLFAIHVHIRRVCILAIRSP